MIELLFLYVMKTVCGTLEVFGELFLGLVLFRLPYFYYLKKLTFISFFVGIVMTLCYEVLSLHFMFNETLNIILVFLLIQIMIKPSPSLTFLITVSGYLIKNALFGLIVMFTNVTAYSLLHSPVVTCIVQVKSFLLLSLASFLLYRFGYGFTLMKDNKIQCNRLNKSNRVLFVVIIMNIIIMYTTFLFLLNNHPYSTYIILFFLFMVNVVFVFIYKMSKTDIELEFEKLGYYDFRNIV